MLVTAINPIDQIIQDGVAVFKNLYSKSQIDIISQEVDAIRHIVANRIVELPRPLKTYSDIAEREPGRFDYRCGFIDDIFAKLAEPISAKIKQASPTIDFRYYWGAIPSLGGSGPTPMHRDVYPILNTTVGDNLDALDINLPPYYFTVLIPLVNITPENGPTQFIKGSHLRGVVDVASEKIYSPLTSPGDVIIFDGRLMHRGSENKTDAERVIAYITYVANWYHDQTFTINDYLFPELSLRDHR